MIKGFLLGFFAAWLLDHFVLVEQRYSFYVRLQRKHGDRWWVEVVRSLI